MPQARKLDTVEDIDELIEKSGDKPVFIFKHSLVCPVSTMAHREFESYLASRPDDDGVDYTLIEIQNARPVSNAVAERTGVRHESPQALLLHGGKVVWHDSHHGIRTDTLEKAVAGVTS